MTTLEHTRETAPHESAATGRRRSNRYAVIAAVAVLALALGAALGWMARGSGDDDPSMVAIGNVDLTERQQDMVALIDESVTGWHASDGAAVAALFTPNGTLTAFDTVYRVNDGSLEAFIDSGTWTSLDVLQPYLVDGDQVITFHEYGGRTYSDTLTFTDTGELLITGHVIHDG